MTTESRWSRGPFDASLRELCRTYAADKQAIEVDFRKLVPIGYGADRATHLMHSYPAKLLPNIPHFFTNCSSLIEKGNTIYDPFCGTGTVLVEGLLSGLKVIGADSNPLARLIAAAKTTHLDIELTHQLIDSAIERSRSAAVAEFQPVIDVDKWFEPRVRTDLGRLRMSIDEVKDRTHKQFLQVCFSQTVKKVSLADPRMSVPVRYKGTARESPDSVATFKRIAIANASRVATLPIFSKPGCIRHDARTPLDPAPASEPVHLIITSPPYAGAQKYIRASSLSLGWLGIVPEGRLRLLEALNIGREHLNRAERNLPCPSLPAPMERTLGEIGEVSVLRAAILRTYLDEMRVAAKAIVDSLAPGGHLVLVMGDNLVCRIPVHTSQYVKRFFCDNGLMLLCELIDTIKSRGLMTKRNQTAGVIAREHVFLFRKPK